MKTIPETFGDRLKHAFSAFVKGEPNTPFALDIGSASSFRPDRQRYTSSSERSIISTIYTHIAIDVAAIALQHVKLDQNGRYLETIQSGLNTCLTLEANIDQSGRSFIQEVVMSMFDEGVLAIVPIDTSRELNLTGSYDVQTMRTGQIVEWYPRHVKVRVYNDQTGQKEDLTLPKETVAIVENPLYSIMNEPNSTLKRLVTKLNLLDSIDNQSASGKLDLIIQLPYVIKSDARRIQAETRRKDIEMQLSGSKFGIAYTDGTEKITQLNRPVENNLLPQIQGLTQQLLMQLGLTDTILNNTADEATMINYFNRTIEPILAAITDAMKRRFLTKTARSQNQSIMYFRDPFKLVPVAQLADIADKFTRNEIASSNDIRAIVGWKPSTQEGSEELRNKNLNQSQRAPKGQPTEQTPERVTPPDQLVGANQNGT